MKRTLLAGIILVGTSSVTILAGLGEVVNTVAQIPEKAIQATAAVAEDVAAVPGEIVSTIEGQRRVVAPVYVRQEETSEQFEQAPEDEQSEGLEEQAEEENEAITPDEASEQAEIVEEDSLMPIPETAPVEKVIVEETTTPAGPISQSEMPAQGPVLEPQQ